jgi:hypothetical protein
LEPGCPVFAAADLQADRSVASRQPFDLGA